MSATQIDLPIARTTSAQQQRLDPRERDRLIRRAKALSWLSLAYMTGEGAIAITAALLAGSDRAARLRPGLRDRSARIGDRHLALHRHAPTLTRRRTPRSAARRHQLLPPRALHRPRRDPHPDRRRAPPHQLARHRTINLQHHRHAPTRHRQAPHRPPPRIRRHHRRRHPEPPLRLPRRRRTQQASRSTPRSASGGPTPPSRSPSPASPSTKAVKPGKARAAAQLHPSTAKPTPAAPTAAAANPCGIGREADHDHTVGAQTDHRTDRAVERVPPQV